MQLTFTRRRVGQGAASAVALVLAGRVALAHAASHKHEILIRDFTFAPADLTIAPGDVVVWKNVDLALHTATAVTGEWDTGEIASDSAATATFEEPGEYRYLCAFHPQMTGRIRVVPLG